MFKFLLAILFFVASPALAAPPIHFDAAPLPDEVSRVTKKPFGIKITPDNSPTKPERFSGYHTGVDFETLPDEQNKDVSVSAICSGRLVARQWVSGYGGVAVAYCKKENVTVLYGHLKLSSVIKRGSAIKTGNKIGVLGKGYSVETDGERKHLHLGIHEGSKIDWHGYVSNEKDLSSWLDFMTLYR